MKDASHFIEFFKDLNTGKLMSSPEPQKISKLKSNLKMTADSKTLKTIFVIKGKMKPGYEDLLNPVIVAGEEINGTSVLIAESIK